jgi:WD40 repeat protein/serine/threonine protein kinase
MIVDACPDSDRLVRFLEEPSPGVDDEAVALHVEGCSACRAELERLAAATELPALRAARTVCKESADLSFLRDLKGLDLRHLGDPPAPRPTAETPRPEIPGYELLGELGRGGAGVVYHARHLTLHRPVAIKMLHPSLFPTEADRTRLRAEAEAVARLQHANVVQLYEVGEAGGSPYLVLEYVSGGTLEAYLNGRPQPPNEAAEVVKTLSHAVHAAHLKQIVHRDLKPANILLRREDTEADDRRAANGSKPASLSSYGIPKVSDFGLAKRLDHSVSGLTQTLSGTPAYMSPEQVPERAGERPSAPITPATDVYALGVILYEMLTGRPPFLGTDWVTTLLQVVRRAPLSPRDLQPGTPRDLETICLKCLEKEPAKRYTTAGELAGDLGRFLDHKPIRARPLRPLGRLARWGRRNPVPAGLLSALGVTGLVALTAILWQWRNAEHARRKAIAAQQHAEWARKAERWERYRSNIAAAAAALQLQNSGTASRALEAAPPEHRNWEWRHLHSQLDNSYGVMPWMVPTSGLSGSWQLPVVSPSGEQIAILDSDGLAIHLWDATTGAAIGSLRGHEGPINALAYSPDGKRLASCSSDKTIRLWDTAAAKEAAELRGHEKPVEWLAYSPDGQRIFSLAGDSGHLWDATTGSAVALVGRPVRHLNAIFTPDSRQLVIALGNKVCLWDATTGRQTATLGSHEHDVVQLAVSPDGKRVASHGDFETIIRLWDIAAGRQVAVLRGDTATPASLAFSPDGSRIASGGPYPDNSVRMWEAATGRPIAEMRGHKNTIQSVAFDSSGRRLVSASLDQTAWLWDGVTGQSVTPLRGHTEFVWHAIFSPNGNRVVTASADQTLRLWDATSGELIAVLRGHTADVRGAAFAANGSLLVSRSAEGESRVWNMELVEQNGILRGHEKFVYDVAVSPDGNTAASAAWDGTVRLWDLTTGRQTALFRHGPADNPDAKIVSSVAWHPSRDQLATVTRSDTITLWDLATGKPRRTFTAPTGAWDGDARAVFNPAGTLLASGSRDGSLRLWDVTTGEPAGVLQGHQGPAIDVVFSPDGNHLASVGLDRTVRLWDVASRAAVVALPVGAEGYRIAYSANGSLIAASTLTGYVRLWNARTCQELATLPHGNRVLGLAFSPDCTRLATGCGDNTIRLWDLATRQEVCELRGHQAYVHALAFSPDGTRLASASGDFTVRIWDTVPQSVRARRQSFMRP